jgi:hypothetical protein
MKRLALGLLVPTLASTTAAATIVYITDLPAFSSLAPCAAYAVLLSCKGLPSPLALRQPLLLNHAPVQKTKTLVLWSRGYPRLCSKAVELPRPRTLQVQPMSSLTIVTRTQQSRRRRKLVRRSPSTLPIYLRTRALLLAPRVRFHLSSLALRPTIARRPLPMLLTARARKTRTRSPSAGVLAR